MLASISGPKRTGEHLVGTPGSNPQSFLIEPMPPRWPADQMRAGCQGENTGQTGNRRKPDLAQGAARIIDAVMPATKVEEIAA
jgi:hypothetical protein